MFKAFTRFKERMENSVAVQATLLAVSIAAFTVAPFIGMPITVWGSIGFLVFMTADNLGKAIHKNKETKELETLEKKTHNN